MAALLSRVRLPARVIPCVHARARSVGRLARSRADEESGKLLERFKLETGKVFCGGHARMVERLFNVEKDELLYVRRHAARRHTACTCDQPPVCSPTAAEPSKPAQWPCQPLALAWPARVHQAALTCALPCQRTHPLTRRMLVARCRRSATTSTRTSTW